MGRQADGRTYEQLRSSLTRLEHTVLQSEQSYFDSASASLTDASFTLLRSVMIERRRSSERDQLALVPTVVAAEPGEARVVFSPLVRQNVAARHVAAAPRPLFVTAVTGWRRLYRLIEVARLETCLPGGLVWTGSANNCPHTALSVSSSTSSATGARHAEAER
jgi:hypothetical protein